ncbi:LOW QUALITY PROTEIN: UBX domain-containing protein 7-like [Lethenteron reissneri]|uniref:UBX domain-containing protein 7-like n=1 Tax=Lethenteron reissneri TaxID=7753 RepID=UPI002AB724A2|nr:UBX domain-containing protein 7-like [Lethenteron reissneri]XP_061405435.1 LOW QUALITY PROTEIN: UBX domain-containing protein 7-like [Lethenteron reissneri]
MAASSSPASGDAESLGAMVGDFCAITGASQDVALHMLEACGNELHTAVTMFLDGGAGSVPTAAASPLDAAHGPPGSSRSHSRSHTHGRVHAPRARHALSTATAATIGAAAGTSQQAEDLDGGEVRAPIPQKQEVLVDPEPIFGAPKRSRLSQSVFDGFRDFQTEAIRQEQELLNGGAVDRRLKTLADLFRPPIDLMHKGTFETAKKTGQSQRKWLMVNIQNVQDFSCQCLNRDVWSHEAVKAVIREHFIFWQVYHDSEEGQRYMQFYKLTEFPYVSVLDPRTGEKLLECHRLDANSLLELVTEFLSTYNLNEASPGKPKKRSRTASLIDASEDSQLEAAIQASLQETHYGPSAAPSPPHSSGAPSDDDNDDDDDEIDNEVAEGSAGGAARTCEDDDDDDEDVCVDSTEGSNPAWEDSGSAGGEEKGPQSRLMVRFPDGKREQVVMAAEATLTALLSLVEARGFPGDRFELVTNFPRRKLAALGGDTTLRQAGLFPHETVFVQERV